jgi:hypothetical protein
LTRICAIASFAAGDSSALIGAVQRLNEVEWMVVGDVLQRVGDAVDQILLADEGHGKGSWWTVSTR